MKKYISIFLVAAMLFANLNGCHKEDLSLSESSDISASIVDSSSASTTAESTEYSDSTDDSSSTSSITESDVLDYIRDNGMITPEAHCASTAYHGDENGDMVVNYTSYRDIDGNTVKLVGYDDDAKVDHETYYGYLFSDDGSILKEMNVSCKNGEIRSTTVCEYIYNSDKTQANRIEYKDGEWNRESLYLYDEHGEFIGMRVKWNEDDTEYTPFGANYEFSYDDNDRIISKRALNSKSGEINSETTYNYDESGLLVNETNVDIKNDETFTKDYTYDDKGNCVRLVTQYIPPQETEMREEIYTYDEQNRLIFEQWFFDGELKYEFVTEYMS